MPELSESEKRVCEVCKGELPEPKRGPKRKTCSYKCRRILFLDRNELSRRKRVLVGKMRYFNEKLEEVRRELVELGYDVSKKE